MELSHGSFQRSGHVLKRRLCVPASLLALALAGGCASSGDAISSSGTGGKGGSSGATGAEGGGHRRDRRQHTARPDWYGRRRGCRGRATGGSGASVDPRGGRGATRGTAARAGCNGRRSPVSNGGAVIVNDTFWKDTAGQNIYSQGGGALRVGDTYYWYGVRYGNDASYAGDPRASSQAITTYSSTDLVHWKPETVSKPANMGGWFGRLGVVYNATTKKYVLAAQGGGGLYFATSDAPGGPFVYNNVQTNLPGITNGGTGRSNAVSGRRRSRLPRGVSSNGRSNRYLSPLRPADFLAAEQAIPVYSGGGREGNCMFKYMGTYTYCSSDLHGWNSSQTYCVSATSVHGPWSTEFVLDGTQSDYSHVTQTGFFITVQGTAGTFVIFAGDRWANNASNGIGFNQWMPISFDGKTPHFHSFSKWSIDAKAGTWAVAHGNNWVLNPSFEADRVSVTVPVGWKATGGHNVLSSFHTGRWSWQLNANGTLEQQATAMPDGTYTLSVWAKATRQRRAAHGQRLRRRRLDDADTGRQRFHERQVRTHRRQRWQMHRQHIGRQRHDDHRRLLAGRRLGRAPLRPS